MVQMNTKGYARSDEEEMRKGGAIESQITGLDQDVDVLRNIIRELETKMTPVLSPEEPSDDEMDELPSDQTQVSLKLHDLQVRIRGAANMLRRIYDRAVI